MVIQVYLEEGATGIILRVVPSLPILRSCLVYVRFEGGRGGLRVAPPSLLPNLLGLVYPKERAMGQFPSLLPFIST